MNSDERLIEEMLYPLRELKKLRDSGHLNSYDQSVIYQSLQYIERRDTPELYDGYTVKVDEV